MISSLEKRIHECIEVLGQASQGDEEEVSQHSSQINE